MSKKTVPPAPPVTNKQLEKIAAIGLERPSALNAAQVQSLSGAVMARIEPRKGK